MPRTINELNSLFQRSDSSLTTHFAEQRTNVLLDTGFHHPRIDRLSNVRSPTVTGLNRRRRHIRITKNHIQKITKHIRNSIQNKAPDGGIFPNNESELSDVKAAELNESVYKYLKEKNSLTSLYAQLVHDFVVIGEVYCKIFWDDQAGDFLGYEQVMGEDGKPTGEGIPKWTGGIIYEKIMGYNLRTDPEANNEETMKWACNEKTMDRQILLDRYIGNEEKQKLINESGGDNLQYFDGLTGIYTDIQDAVSLREFYFKPSPEYPNGYFYFATERGILEEGELPDGFCLFSCSYDEAPNSCRAFSIIRQVKPYQVEINRLGAAMIMESIVLGHTTVIYPAGSKLSSNALGNGLKGLQYTGGKPDIVPGQDGRQYEGQMTQQIEEMYRIANVPMNDDDKQSQGQDALAMLGRSLRDKMRFSLYGEKIEKMITDMIEYSLALARRYLTEEMVIPIVGKAESVNIAEFKTTDPLLYHITIRPRSEDFTTVMGETIQLSQLLQYAGSSLPEQAIGSIARNMHFVNDKDIMRDLTSDQDMADNCVLALDRGEQPFYFETGNHEYMLSRITQRMNSPDFPLLKQEIKMNYQQQVDRHTKSLMAQQQEASRATSGFIPSGGGLITVDYYITNEKGKQKRAKVPYEAIDWLIKKLGDQGSKIDEIEQMPEGAQARLGRAMGEGGGGGGPKDSFQGQQGMGQGQGSAEPTPPQNVYSFPGK